MLKDIVVNNTTGETRSYTEAVRADGSAILYTILNLQIMTLPFNNDDPPAELEPWVGYWTMLVLNMEWR